MNILLTIIMIVGGAAGLLSTVYIVVSLFGTLGFKIYRRIFKGISVFIALQIYTAYNNYKR